MWVAFIIVATVVVLWFVVCYLNAPLGGWQALAKRYRSNHEVPLTFERRMQAGTMRSGIRYTILTIGVTAQGLSLRVAARSRTGHPPLLIPWDEVSILDHPGRLYGSIRFNFNALPGVTLDVGRDLGYQVAHAAGRAITTSAQTR